jgi:hypothetical protein
MSCVFMAMPCLVLCFLARRKEVLVLYFAFISCLLVDMDHQKQNYLVKFILRSHVTIVFTVCSFLKHWPGLYSDGEKGAIRAGADQLMKKV